MRRGEGSERIHTTPPSNTKVKKKKRKRNDLFSLYAVGLLPFGKQAFSEEKALNPYGIRLFKVSIISKNIFL